MRPALGITPLGPKDAGGPGDATPPRGLSMRNQNIAPQIDVCRRRHRQRFLTPMETVMGTDVAPSFYPATIGVWSSVMPCWAVVAAVRGAKPSVERSAADRRAAA